MPGCPSRPADRIGGRLRVRQARQHRGLPLRRRRVAPMARRSSSACTELPARPRRRRGLPLRRRRRLPSVDLVVVLGAVEVGVSRCTVGAVARSVGVGLPRAPASPSSTCLPRSACPAAPWSPSSPPSGVALGGWPCSFGVPPCCASGRSVDRSPDPPPSGVSSGWPSALLCGGRVLRPYRQQAQGVSAKFLNLFSYPQDVHRLGAVVHRMSPCCPQLHAQPGATTLLRGPRVDSRSAPSSPVVGSRRRLTWSKEDPGHSPRQAAAASFMTRPCVVIGLRVPGDRRRMSSWDPAGARREREG